MSKYLIDLHLVGFDFFSTDAKENFAVKSKENRVFMSRNYRLIVAPPKFDVLKTSVFVLRTSNFGGANIRPIVPRQKHSIV